MASRHWAVLNPPGVLRYRSSTPTFTVAHCSGNANRARTSVCSATAAAKIGQRCASLLWCRSAMSTGVPVVAACMQAPSFRVNCSSSNSSAVGSVAHRVSRDTVAVSTEITAPSTSSPATQARQIRSATACSSTPSSPPASSAWVTVPSSAIAAALSGDAHIEFSHEKPHPPDVAGQ